MAKIPNEYLASEAAAMLKAHYEGSSYEFLTELLHLCAHSDDPQIRAASVRLEMAKGIAVDLTPRPGDDS